MTNVFDEHLGIAPSNQEQTPTQGKNVFDEALGLMPPTTTAAQNPLVTLKGLRRDIGGRVSEAGEYLESKRKQWTSPTEQKGKTPEWAGKSPGLYGALGALRESAVPVAEGAALGSNMTPLGIATGGLKYAAVDQIASILDKMLGNKEDTTLGEQAKQALWKTAEGVIAKGVLGSVVPAAQGVRAGYTGASPKTVTGTAINTAKESFKEADILATGVEGVNKTIKQTVKAFMPKAIGTSPKNTMRGMDKYADDITPAVEDIVAHKNALDQTGDRVLNFIDKKGQPLKNNIPNKADDQLQAIQTRKPQIWKETLGEIQEASQGGAIVPVQPMVGKLESLLTKEKESLIPDAATKKHIVGIIERMKQYEKTGVPLQQAQQELTQLNAKIFGTAKIEYDSFGKKEVDQYIASYLRNTLDDTIAKFTGTPRYENLKRLYGSYRTLEDDTIKAVSRSAKKQDFSMFDISDIWIGYHTGVSALTGNVPGLIAAGGSELAKKYMVTRMKPDSQLKTMYERVDKLMEQKSKFENPRTEFGQSMQKGMIEGGGYKSRAEARKVGPEPINNWEVQTEAIKPSKAAQEISKRPEVKGVESFNAPKVKKK